MVRSCGGSSDHRSSTGGDNGYRGLTRSMARSLRSCSTRSAKCTMTKDFASRWSEALHWYRHCNTNSSGKEGSLVLGMAALDLLSALIVVDRCRSMSAQEHDRLGAARKLRALLKALDVPADIPSRYAALTAFAERNGRSDSCEALAKLRHGFVHANEKRRNVVSGSDGKAACLRRMAVVALVPGTGVAPPVATSRKLQKQDNR